MWFGDGYNPDGVEDLQRAGGKCIPSEHTACANGPLEEQAQEAEVTGRRPV